MFDLAIDSKLRGCDIVKIKIGDLVSGGQVRVDVEDALALAEGTEVWVFARLLDLSIEESPDIFLRRLAHLPVIAAHRPISQNWTFIIGALRAAGARGCGLRNRTQRLQASSLCRLTPRTMSVP
jgi:hypothetical protein